MFCLAILSNELVLLYLNRSLPLPGSMRFAMGELNKATDFRARGRLFSFSLFFGCCCCALFISSREPQISSKIFATGSFSVSGIEEALVVHSKRKC